MEFILSGIANTFLPGSLLMMVLGLAFGMVIGVLPGFSGTMGLTIMLPFTYTMDPINGLVFLTALNCGACYAGSISACLINTPGTPSAAATVIDGYALTKKGKAYHGLNMSLTASVFGGIISWLSLILFAPQVAKLALAFGPAEYFMLALFGLSVIIGIGGNIFKGLFMGMLGFFLSCIGMDPVYGNVRFTFGTYQLLDGIPVVAALIGLFAVAEVLNQVFQQNGLISSEPVDFKERISLLQTLKYWKNMLKGSLIGVVIGAIPGTGGPIASFIAYNEAKKSSKHPEEFGHGSLEGIAACEAANNGVTGSSMIPMMTLGIPGDASTAILMSAMFLKGLTPGPMMFKNNVDLVYTIMIAFLVIQIIMYFMGKLAIRASLNITKLSSNIVMPCVICFSLVGSFAAGHGSLYYVLITIIFGLIGYLMPKYGFPKLPLILGLILGNIAESNFLKAMLLSKGSLLIFVTRPICLVILIVTVFSLVYPTVKSIISKTN